jgi:hypothetical protein
MISTDNSRALSLSAATPSLLTLLKLVRWPVLVLLAVFSFGLLPAGVQAEPAGLSGSWSGGGWVAFAGGQRERARCRAHFEAHSEASVTVSAQCATESGSVEQVARLRKTGANTYSGSFHNDQYDVRGRISVTVHGNTQHVRLISDSGSAELTLKR